MGVEGGVGGVAEGAEHSGYVSEGGLLGAAFGEGAGRFSFEVEDDEVFAGSEKLAEMVVAVDADALAGVEGCGRGDGVSAGEEIEAAAENKGCVVGCGFVQLWDVAFEGGESGGELGVDTVGVGGEVGGGEALGGEGWVVGWGGEGEVHLGGAAAEEGGGVEVEGRRVRGWGWDWRLEASRVRFRVAGSGRSLVEVGIL